MSFLENDLMVDATFELLNDTIAMQSLQLEELQDKLASLHRNHQRELKDLKREHLAILKKQEISFAENFDELESKLGLKQEKIRKLEADLKSVNAKSESLIEANESLRLKLASNQKELHLKDEAICQQFQEISELKKKLCAEKLTNAQLEAACLELKISLKKKSQELEESIEDLNESYLLIEKIKSTSEASEAKLAEKMFQLKQKIEQTCGAAMVCEASNKELDTENKNLSNLVGELMEDVETFKDAKENLEVKVYDLEVAKSDLAFAVHQKEEIIGVLMSDSAKNATTVEQLLTDIAHKDDSFRKLYETYLEESKEKDDVIRGLKLTLADNSKEISDLRREVMGILENCV